MVGKHYKYNRKLQKTPIYAVAIEQSGPSHGPLSGFTPTGKKWMISAGLSAIEPMEPVIRGKT